MHIYKLISHFIRNTLPILGSSLWYGFQNVKNIPLRSWIVLTGSHIHIYIYIFPVLLHPKGALLDIDLVTGNEL